MNTMPKSSEPTSQQKERADKRDENIALWKEKAAAEDHRILGDRFNQGSDVYKDRNLRGPSKAKFAKDMKDATKQRLKAEKADAATTEKAKFDDLTERMDRIHLDGQGRGRRTRKRKGGKRKTRRRA